MAMNRPYKSPSRPGRLSPLSGLHSAFFTAVSPPGFGESTFSQRIDYIPQKQDCSRAYSPTAAQNVLIEEEEETLFPPLFSAKWFPSSRLSAPQWRKCKASLQQKGDFPLHNAALRRACQALPVLCNSPKPHSERAQSNPKKPARNPESPLGKAFPASLPLCIEAPGSRNSRSQPLRCRRRRGTDGFADSKLQTRTISRFV